MTPFWSGFLGALAALVVLVTIRRIFWFAAWRRWRRRGHVPGAFARRGLGHVFRRLGTRPEQESVLRAEAEQLFSELAGFRGDAFALREELASLFADPALDEASVAAALEKPLSRLADLRAKVAGSLARIHAALDEAQRQRLADLVRHGRRHPHAGGHGPRHATV